MTPPSPRAPAVAIDDRGFFGHPRGLATLFFTEMWERFSYYGMRALLILFMTDAVTGLGMTTERAGAIYGLYTFGVYALALPGGWMADRLMGQRRAVLYGGVLIALGHYSLAVPSGATFYAGLLLIALGTGLLKPNISAIVGDLYPEKGARRDAAFSIFYMGINVGALFGPLLCSFLGEPREGATWVSWHYGFGAAGVGMTFAIIQYMLGQPHLRGAGELKDDSAHPSRVGQAWRQFGLGLAAAVLLIAAVVGASAGGIVPLTLVGFAESIFYLVTAIFIVYFLVVVVFLCRDLVERQRVIVIALLCLGAAMFWAGFEQAGSSMNLFARDLTDRVIFGTEITAGTLQTINPIFIIVLAPLIGMLWVGLGARNPSIPAKFGYGLLLLGSGFLVMAWASTFLVDGKVGMQWLVATYFLHTIGELCLSPVGLSSVTKLSPNRLVGQMMGMWFMGAAIGNLVAGLLTRFMPQAETAEAAMANGVQLFGTVAAVSVVAGLVFLVFAGPIRRLCAGVN
jgi:POT family proton-dependent oligopeptide transporter